MLNKMIKVPKIFLNYPAVKRCEVPRAPVSGSLVDCSWINGATCGYQCNDGYELAGVSQRRCELNDDTLPSWDSLPPTCQGEENSFP